MKYFILMLKKWNDFSGRATRAEFWWPTLITWLIANSLNFPNLIISPIVGHEAAYEKAYHTTYLNADTLNLVVNVLQPLASIASLMGVILSLILFVPSLALSVRRLHDVNRSGWWYLLLLINIIWYARRGDYGPNRFGPPSPYAVGTPMPAPMTGPILAQAPVQAAPPPPSATGTMDRFAALEKLAALHAQGILNDTEFAEQKQRILSQS